MMRYLFAVLVFVPVLAGAQESGVEITPYVGYRFGGTFESEETTAEYEMQDSSSFGLLVNFPHKRNTQWEVLYSQQSSAADYSGMTGPDPEVDVEIHVLQLGGTYLFDGEKAQPYLAATIGGTHIRTESTTSQDDTFFSGSIGLGVKFMPSARIGIRLEARAYGTLIDSSSQIFCSTGPDQKGVTFRF
jgi:opacity protein-like surface antigen